MSKTHLTEVARHSRYLRCARDDLFSQDRPSHCSQSTRRLFAHHVVDPFCGKKRAKIPTFFVIPGHMVSKRGKHSRYEEVRINITRKVLKKKATPHKDGPVILGIKYVTQSHFLLVIQVDFDLHTFVTNPFCACVVETNSAEKHSQIRNNEDKSEKMHESNQVCRRSVS